MKADILGCQVDMVSMDGALAAIDALVKKAKAGQVITLNAEILYQACFNPGLQQLINRADLVTPDGIGVIWGARQLGYSLSERVTGIDLVYRLADRAAGNGWKLYLLGSAPGVAERAAETLVQLNPGLRIAGTHHGYFNAEQEISVLEDIKLKGPDLLLVALGAPRQEKWINQYKDWLGVPVSVGVGGSFDVIAGMKKRAPAVFIRLNLEWLYRLLSEPGRIGRQMALPRFAVMILREKFCRPRK